MIAIPSSSNFALPLASALSLLHPGRPNGLFVSLL
jgi:hypothetical protein